MCFQNQYLTMCCLVEYFFCLQMLLVHTSDVRKGKAQIRQHGYELFIREKIIRMIWLVVLGFNGTLRQYFSLYRDVSQRGRKKKKTRVKLSKQPHPHLLQAQQALALLLSKLVGRPGTERVGKKSLRN